jgi:hypothetical protein
VTHEIIEAGLANANAAWRRIALVTIEKLCREKSEITADDLRDAMSKTAIETHDRRAVGGLMRTAKGNGWCEPTGVHVPSKYTHGHLHQVWKSKIYRPKETLF